MALYDQYHWRKIMLDRYPQMSIQYQQIQAQHNEQINQQQMNVINGPVNAVQQRTDASQLNMQMEESEESGNKLGAARSTKTVHPKKTGVKLAQFKQSSKALQKQKFQAQHNERINQHKMQQMNVVNVPDLQKPVASRLNTQSEKSEDGGNKARAARLTKTVLTKKTGVKLAQIKQLSKVLQKKKFPCPNCDYVSKRKYTLKIHKEQHCDGANIPKDVIKNKICDICQKSYTHDGLRSHLRGFIDAPKKNRKVRGIHVTFSAEYHETYLNKIKLRYL